MAAQALHDLERDEAGEKVSPDGSAGPDEGSSLPKENLPSGMDRMRQALQDRDRARSSPAATGAKPKAKSKSKAPAVLKRPASKAEVATQKKKVEKAASKSYQKSSLKKPASKKQHPSKNTKKKDQKVAVQLKMTRECVYSRAYHQAKNKFRKVKTLKYDQILGKARSAAQREVDKVFGKS